MNKKLCKAIRSCFDILATATAVAAMILRESWYLPLLRLSADMPPSFQAGEQLLAENLP